MLSIVEADSDFVVRGGENDDKSLDMKNAVAKVEEGRSKDKYVEVRREDTSDAAKDFLKRLSDMQDWKQIDPLVVCSVC